MAAKIGTLLIDIQANIARLQQDFSKAQSTVNGAVGKMGAAVKAFGVAAVGYMSGRAILGVVDAAIDGADALGKLSTRSGVAVETLSALGHAASLGDASVQDVARGLGMLSMKAIDASNGSKEAARAFAQLGVDFKGPNGEIRASDEMLMDIADTFARLPDGPVKAGLAMKLFGESGTKLIPMLNSGRAGLEEMKKEAEALGLVVGEDTARQAEAFNDNMTRLSKVTTGLANGVIEELLPTLLKFTDWLVDGSKKLGGLGKVADFAFKLVATGVIFVTKFFEKLGQQIGGVAAALVQVFSGEFSAAWDTLKQTASDTNIFTAFNEATEEAAALWFDLGDAVELADQANKKATTAIGKDWSKLAKAAKEMAQRVEDSMLRIQGIEAKATATKTDDVKAQYAAQKVALLRKIEDEKTSEEEAQQYLRELYAVNQEEKRELAAAEIEETRELERRKIDIELETRAMKAQLTETELDDLAVSYEEQLEALRRQREDELLTEQEYAERRRLLLAHREEAITSKSKEVAEKRSEAQKKAVESVVSYVSTSLVDLVLLPLEDGFKGLKTILATLKKMVVDLIKQLVVAGIVKMITGATSGGIGGAVLTAVGFSKGGPVHGPGTETSDSIPALLSKGEFVVNAQAARRFGIRRLEAINSLGLMPAVRPLALAGGGLVGGKMAYAAVGGAPAVYNFAIAALDPQTTATVVQDRIAPANARRYRNRQGGLEAAALARYLKPLRTR